METIVAVARHENYNKEEVSIKLEKILEESKILELIKNKNILIKPNCTGIFPPNQGRTTHPAILRCLIKIIKPICKSVVIGESSSYGVNTKKAFETTRITQVSKELSIPLIDFKDSAYSDVKIKNPTILKKLGFPDEVLKKDYIISLAKMKTNYVSTISCSVKNMKGLLKDSDKKMFHKIGLSKALADLVSCFPNTISIVDGILANELYSPKISNVLLASKDPVACDATCARIMGIDPDLIEHLRLAQEKRLGIIQMDKIRIKGEDLSTLIKRFKTTFPDFRSIEKRYKINIVDGKPCSNCIGALCLCLKKCKLENPDILNNLTILIGPEIKEKTPKKSIFFGNCASIYTNSNNVLGCTPISSEFIKILKNLNI